MTIYPDKRLLSGVEIIGSGNLRDADSPVHWSIDPDSGVVQGPLDLCFVSGRTLILSLDENQVAILAVDNELQSVYLQGIHSVAVCPNGAPCEPGQALIHFLHLSALLEIPWRQHIPVAPVRSEDPTSRLAHGCFAIEINDPIRFYRAFLMGHAGETDQICVDALSHLLPTILSVFLSRICGPQATGEKQDKALTTLQPADLDAVLAPYGFCCLDIQIKVGHIDILASEPTAYLPSITAAC